MKRIETRGNDFDFSSRKGFIKISPRRLVELLGPPTRLDPSDGKAPLAWMFQDERGAYEIYSYKATKEYHPSLPSIEEFLNQDTEFSFGIGSKRSIESFIDWLTIKVASDKVDLGSS